MARSNLKRYSSATEPAFFAGILAAVTKPVAAAISFIGAFITGWSAHWSLYKDKVILLRRKIPKRQPFAACENQLPNSTEPFAVLSAKLPTLEHLTAREKTVLMLILSRQTMNEIATELQISSNTVRTHFRRICAKFYVGTKNELLEMAGMPEASDRLTYREREVLRYVVAGQSDANIAEKLSISTNTVRSHIFNIRKKFDLDERCELSSLMDDMDAVS